MSHKNLLLPFLFICFASVTYAEEAMLRVSCEGADVDAEIYINGKFKGQCPVDMKVPEGDVQLRATKKIDGEHDGVFEKNLKLAGGTVKRVDVVLAPELSATGKARQAETERLAAQRAEQQHMAAQRAAAEAALADEKAIQEKAVLIKKLQDSYGKSWVMMSHEVTFDEWEECTDELNDPCGDYEPDDMGWGEGKRPVVNVNYQDAEKYAQWFSHKTGKKYRLPTEHEWEAAARAGTTTNFWWGSEVDTNKANCNGCGSKWDNEKTAPVRSFKPNAYGLYDTVGNVKEWTSSCWDAGCSTRVVRGGSWSNIADYCNVTFRGANADADRSAALGFRLVEDL